MTHRHRKWRILRSRIRKVDPKVWIPSGGTVRLHILSDRGGAWVYWSVYCDRYLFYDRISWISDRQISEGSICPVCCIRDNYPHIRPGRDQYRGQPQHRPPHRSYSPIRQLWWIISPLYARLCRHPPLDISTSRVSPTEDH
jgi:hypothetical protein